MNMKKLFVANGDTAKLDRALKTIKIVNGVISAISLIWYIMMSIKIYRNLYKSNEDIKIERSMATKEKGLNDAEKRVKRYDKIIEKYHALWRKAKADEAFYRECYVDEKGNLCHNKDSIGAIKEYRKDTEESCGTNVED